MRKTEKFLSTATAPGTPYPSVAGATTPFTTYQAPEAALGGGAGVVSLTSAPTSQYGTPQVEADGHAYVQLTGTGQYVQWTNNTGQPINFINVRASIPDSSTGGGITANLDLYVNGTFRQVLNMNSVQSWQYDIGGQGVAYNVISANGTANSYRSDGTDLESCSDNGCGYDLGWTSPGQWFRYKVNVASAGSYTVSFRVAAPSAVADAFHLTDASGNDLTAEEPIPATGGWQGWATVTDTVQLAAGQQTFFVDQDNSGWNLRYLSFTSSGGGGTGSPLTASPSSLSFGSTTVGSTSSAQTVTVSNPGSSAATAPSVSVSGPFSQ